MNVRLNLFLLFIAALLAGVYFSQMTPENEGLADLIKKDGMPEYTGEKMSTSVFDEKGKPQYFAQAQEIKRYENTDRTEFFKPLLNLFDKVSALKQWQVNADYAEITKEKMLHLKGNVKIQSLEPTSRLQTIETDQLSVDLNSQDVMSDSVVKTVGLGFTTTGRGLAGNLKEQVATLKNEVKTYIEPTIIKQTNESADSK